jgi:hypothetical protein
MVKLASVLPSDRSLVTVVAIQIWVWLTVFGPFGEARESVNVLHCLVQSLSNQELWGRPSQHDVYRGSLASKYLLGILVSVW